MNTTMGASDTFNFDNISNVIKDAASTYLQFKNQQNQIDLQRQQIEAQARATAVKVAEQQRILNQLNLERQLALRNQQSPGSVLPGTNINQYMPYILLSGGGLLLFLMLSKR